MRFKDSGPGIVDPERLFSLSSVELRQRVWASISRARSSGLLEATVRAAIRRMLLSYRIDAESRKSRLPKLVNNKQSNHHMINRLRLLLVDDHTLFRASLSRRLESESDFEIIAHCASVQGAIDVIKQTHRCCPARLRSWPGECGRFHQPSPSY